ncbi:hypothetical protein ACRAWC_00205 [Leifsonia sp. L25]|uniref:hypothetical protein n=1 Tax=Leifsonia sp. L25 TaxID=3423957 RepID=UPI003D685665
MSLWSRARMPGPRERSEAPAGGSGWALSPAVTAAAIVAAVCLVAAFVLSRPELVLVAAPLLLAAVVGWSSRPETAAARTRVTIAGDDADGRVGVDAVAEADGRADGVHLRIHRADRRPEDAVVTPRGPRGCASVSPSRTPGRNGFCRSPPVGSARTPRGPAIPAFPPSPSAWCGRPRSGSAASRCPRACSA